MLEARKQKIVSAIEVLARRFDFVLAPGFKNSGEQHWQSEWQTLTPVFHRITQRRWDEPAIDLWISAISRELAKCDKPAVVIGHSLGAIAACAAPASDQAKVAGLMLVAPPEPTRFDAEDVVPTGRLYAPGLVVASQNDPLMTYARAEEWAGRWGARLVDLGYAGHINAESGYGAWLQGLAILSEFVGSIPA